VLYPEKQISCLRSPCHSMRRHRHARVQHSCDVFYVSVMCDRAAVSECGVSASHAITNRGVPTDPTSAPLQELLAALDEGPWESLARRRVKHYGFEFRYLTPDVDPGAPIEPIPPLVGALLARLRAAGATDRLDQLTVNEYEAGVGLSPHIDTHSAFTGESLLKPLALGKLPPKVAAAVSCTYGLEWRGIGCRILLFRTHNDLEGACTNSTCSMASVVIKQSSALQAPSCRCRSRARR